MAPTLIHRLVSKASKRSAEVAGDALAGGTVLLGRDTSSTDTKSLGVTSPKDINNNAMFALFGLLGAAIVVALIWFFFWAKNGGFYFKENDWEDYKSTVLRRRGPNGTILSNATPSTNLGGGSIYKDVDDYTEDATTVSGGSDLSGITAGVSDIVAREKRRKKQEQRSRDKRREKESKKDRHSEKSRDKSKKKERSAHRKVNKEGIMVDENAEAEAQAYLRNYRHEKAARVGGLNRAGDGSAWDGSTNPSASSAATESTVTSELMKNRERTPTSTPTKKNQGVSGIRKVYSTTDRNADREEERLRSEARRVREQRSSRHSHRDFSWQYGEDSSTPLRHVDDRESRMDDGGSHVPGSWADSTVSSDLGTKAYRHVIPGLSSNYSATESTVSSNPQREERRKRRERTSGYRRE